MQKLGIAFFSGLCLSLSSGKQEGSEGDPKGGSGEKPKQAGRGEVGLRTKEEGEELLEVFCD